MTFCSFVRQSKQHKLGLSVGKSLQKHSISHYKLQVRHKLQIRGLELTNTDKRPDFDVTWDLKKAWDKWLEKIWLFLSNVCIFFIDMDKLCDVFEPWFDDF